jgi:hypothetical protein
VRITPTRLPPRHVSLLHDSPGVSSWATPLTTKAIATLIFGQTARSSLDMWFLMRIASPSLSCLIQLTYIFFISLSPRFQPLGPEGPEKATRGGGGEWEPIKIPRRNLAYIPKSTRRPSLLTRPRPHSYNKAIGLQNRVRDRSGNTKQCKQDHM